tara:strand:- start:119 stop:331 length:213 start_codon:yes stop_codon:yes gene_type:complete
MNKTPKEQYSEFQAILKKAADDLTALNGWWYSHCDRLRMDNAKLRKQLEHERREREAAQRTIARLGGADA